MKKILIPSKGRAGNSNLLADLNANKALCAVFVEPNEVNTYKSHYPDLEVVNIEVNEQGLPYARNFISVYANKQNLDWYWLLDDDITLYYVEDSGKQIKRDYKCLYEAEPFLMLDGVAQGALEYKQFAWSNPNKVHYNGYCHCAVLINTTLCDGIYCDGKLDLKIDQDFSIQIIRAGHKNMRISRYAVGSPKNGSNGGGLNKIYHKEEENCYKMIAKWGETICQKIVKPDGRHDIKINWSKINSKQITLF